MTDFYILMMPSKAPKTRVFVFCDTYSGSLSRTYRRILTLVVLSKARIGGFAWYVRLFLCAVNAGQ